MSRVVGFSCEEIGFESPATAEQPLIVVDEFLPHHPLRGLTLEETAPTDEELSDNTPAPEVDYAASNPPDDPPGNEPPTHTGGDDGSEPDEPDDEFAAFDSMSQEAKKRYTIEKYGFCWGEKPTTPGEIAGRKRYDADRQRATAERNKRIDELLNGRKRKIQAAIKKRKATIARKKREAAAQAARAAKEAEREARRKAREEARQAARAAKQEALEAERKERAEFKALARELGVPLQKARWTAKHQAIWDKGVRRKAKEKLEAERDERRKQRLARQAAEADGKAERAKALEEKRRIIREKYGFTLGKVINTPEEIEGRKRWLRDKEAEDRKRNHDKITAYNRLYRRRKRAEALYEEQANWTPEQWAAWEKKQSAKECPQGSPQWLVREVVKHLARENDLPEDAVLERLMELDGLDFLVKGAESLGEAKCARSAFVIAAVRALALYLDPDNAAMFGNRGTGN